MVRFAHLKFPLVFGGTLAVLVVGFHYRRRLFPEVEEIHRRRAAETEQQAAEFKQKLAEGIKRERERRAAEDPRQ